MSIAIFSVSITPMNRLSNFDLERYKKHRVEEGAKEGTIKRISGRKTLIMVERYSHQNGAHIRAAMEKLEERYNAGPKVF